MGLKLERSEKLFSRAQSVIPGGVNSPVRAFKKVGGTPPFIVRGDGSRLFDVDGNSYIDYICSWGPLILGHAHPVVTSAVREAVAKGTSFGTPTEAEVQMAELIVSAFDSIELVRLVNSGTEAVMSAIRLARAFTGRDRVVKFEGCYHGHSDGLLAKAGSGLLTLGIPDCPGVPAAFSNQTLVVPYNDAAAVQAVFEQYKGEIACVIVEPVAGNMGVVPPEPDFLESLREITRRKGALLIFDEVITGFRVAYGGAQELYGVEADITCLGKIIGGGLPIGAYGGRREVMELVAPIGEVYQAGTLSGNPLAVAAGKAVLEHLRDNPGVYQQLEVRSRELEQCVKEMAASAGVPCRINRVGSMMTVFFTRAEEVCDFQTASTADTDRYARFFHSCLENGCYFAPSQFEAAFLSAAHSEKDVRETAAAVERAFLGL